MCPTFGRPQRLLEESVYSFLRQDYPGAKELLILNDFDRQAITFDHPEVRIFNCATRFGSLGEKRNAAAALCRYDLIAVWDDDDIYLPHRLTFSAARYHAQRRFFKANQAFVMYDGAVRGPRTSRFHGASLWHRSLLEEAGGYAHIGSGEDADLEIRFQAIAGEGIDYELIAPDEIYYIYRWKGTHSYHLSRYGRDGDGPTANDRVAEYVAAQIERGEIASGKIALEPQWTVDYAQLVRDYVAGLGERARSFLPQGRHGIEP